MTNQKIKTAIIGLSFGAEFIPIHQAHPNTQLTAICQRNPTKLNQIADHFQIPKRYTNYTQLLQDPEIQAIHLNTPIPDHAPQTLQALQAGKHVLCTVPMATTLQECQQICQTIQQTKLKYMMAETVTYSREFLYLKQLHQQGQLGKIQYLAATHPQDMDGWPDYWQTMIPMHYATHVVSPCLGILNAKAQYVSCFGSGTTRPSIAKKSGSTHAVQTCHIKIKDTDLTAHIWRSLYDVARQYRESIDIYGTKKSFEWTLIENQPHILHTAKKPEPQIPQKITIPDYAHLLPQPIQKFTQTTQDNQHLSFLQGSGHGGSHPHLLHEFITAILQNRDPWPNATTAANWTAVGICANQSAQQGGAIINLPPFTLN